MQFITPFSLSHLRTVGRLRAADEISVVDPTQPLRLLDNLKTIERVFPAILGEAAHEKRTKTAVP